MAANKTTTIPTAIYTIPAIFHLRYRYCAMGMRVSLVNLTRFPVTSFPFKTSCEFQICYLGNAWFLIILKPKKRRATRYLIRPFYLYIRFLRPKSFRVLESGYEKRIDIKQVCVIHSLVIDPLWLLLLRVSYSVVCKNNVWWIWIILLHICMKTWKPYLHYAKFRILLSRILYPVCSWHLTQFFKSISHGLSYQKSPPGMKCCRLGIWGYFRVNLTIIKKSADLFQ
jgi:hypothetical protein